MRLPEYFKDKELACRCGCGLLPPKSAVERLYMLRIVSRARIIILSGARCEAHNRAVGGRAGSIHLPGHLRTSQYREGGAFDISFAGIINRMTFFDYAVRVGFKGFGWQMDSLHIDDAERSRVIHWGY